MLNVELLEETMQHIEKNPQTWRQSVWFVHVDEDGFARSWEDEVEFTEVNSCGTSFCFAGHAALKAGFVKPPKSNSYAWVSPEGQHVEDFARTTLGLTYEQADLLFGPDNSMEDLRKMVDAIKANPEIEFAELEDLLGDYDENDCTCCQ